MPCQFHALLHNLGQSQASVKCVATEVDTADGKLFTSRFDPKSFLTISCKATIEDLKVNQE